MFFLSIPGRQGHPLDAAHGPLVKGWEGSFGRPISTSPAAASCSQSPKTPLPAILARTLSPLRRLYQSSNLEGVGRWALEIDPLRSLRKFQPFLCGYGMGQCENMSDFRRSVVEMYFDKDGFGRWALGVGSRPSPIAPKLSAPSLRIRNRAR